MGLRHSAIVLNVKPPLPAPDDAPDLPFAESVIASDAAFLQNVLSSAESMEASQLTRKLA